MAEDLGRPIPTPRVGIAGNTQPLPQMERQVSTKAESSPVDFQSALTNLAFTPTALGELGSQLMQSSSQALAQRMGQHLGEKPHGNLLPPITDFDKAVSESYMAQTQSTLGLQATSLLNQGAEELSKQNRLTPAGIAAYTQNMTEGVQDLIDLAPDKLKPQLASQYGSHILNSTHDFNTRLQTQQKNEAASKDAAWRTQQSDAIQNALKDGDEKLAISMQQSLNENIKASVNSGNMMPNAGQTALLTAKLNYESSKSIKTWMDAKANGTSDEYLKSIADKKIEGLTWSESETVRDNTVKHAGAEEAAENRNESLFMAQAQQEIALGTFNQDRANFFEQNLRPLQYTRLMTQYAISNHSNAGKTEAHNFMVSNADNASTFIGATKEQINSTYADLVQDSMQKAELSGQPISQQDAQYQAAAFMATPVPDVIDGINRGLKNGNAAQALDALQMYERLHSLEGNKTIGVDDKSLAVAQVFQDLLPSNEGNPEGALQLAKQTVLNKDESIIKLNNLNISRFHQKHASDAAHSLSNAVNIAGIGGRGTNIDNKGAFIADINSRFNGYMQLTDSNEDQSKKLVARDVAKIWGETTVNGKPEITRLPIEGMIGIPKGATPLIQEDMIEQIKPQLEQSKIANQNGTLPYYWRIKEGRVSYEDYTKAKSDIEAKMNLKTIHGLKSNDLGELKGEQSSFTKLRESLSLQRKIVSEFESGKPVEIEQVLDNGTIKNFNLNVQSSNWANISPKTGRVEGGVNMMVVDPESGIRSALTGYYGSTKTQPQYIPNGPLINSRFLSVNGLIPRTKEQLEHEYQINAQAIRNALSAEPY